MNNKLKKHLKVSLTVKFILYLIVTWITFDPIWFENILNDEWTRGMSLFVVAFMEGIIYLFLNPNMNH